MTAFVDGEESQVLETLLEADGLPCSEVWDCLCTFHNLLRGNTKDRLVQMIIDLIDEVADCQADSLRKTLLIHYIISLVPPEVAQEIRKAMDDGRFELFALSRHTTICGESIEDLTADLLV